jgi:UDP-glucose 4-epimerase
VELQQAGFDAVIVDNLCNSSADSIDGIARITGRRPAFEQVDCTDYGAMDKVFGRHAKIDAVIHFAALKAVGESVQKPLQYYQNNLISLFNLLNLMRQHGVEHLVFSSSCTVYGQPAALPVSEQAPRKDAESPYGNTKRICEDIISDYAKAQSGFDAILLRYFNPIGAHASGEIGELPIGVPQNLVPFVTQTAAGIRPQLCVFGNDYNTPDGSCIRDYINVVDLAKAHVIACRRMLEGRGKHSVEVFNLGTGRGVSVLEIVRAFERAAGVKLNCKIAPRRAGDIEQIWADPSFANAELGWQAHETLDDTLRSAWKWQQKLGGK